MKSWTISSYVIFYFLFQLLFSEGYSATVSPETARQHAINLLQGQQVNVSLKEVETDSQGDTLLYIFDLNNDQGFMILSAKAMENPLIGYSLTGGYQHPQKNHPLSFILQQRKMEISQLPDNINQRYGPMATNALSTAKVKPSAQLGLLPTAVAPLVQTTWDQGTYYNALCPGGSVTGCVATAMAQIMRYWSYPAKGTGANTYCSCIPDYTTSFGTTMNTYGNLTCNFGNTTFNWANMPIGKVTAANNDVATLMYACGVSVNMSYSPSGSGAYLLTENNAQCSETAYRKYFGYDSTTLKGIVMSNYTDSAWLYMMKNELDLGRPIQMGGQDVNLGEGHSWVCDGYNKDFTFHMNWGWSGSNNGYFTIARLAPGSVFFSQFIEAIMGIQPNVLKNQDVSFNAWLNYKPVLCDTTITPLVQIQNTGFDTLKACDINVQIDHILGQTTSWTAQNRASDIPYGGMKTFHLPTINLPTGQHDIAIYTALPNGAIDQRHSNDTLHYPIYVSPKAINPYKADTLFNQTFEGITALPLGWVTTNPKANYNWQVVNNVSKAGTNCLGFNNCGDHVDDVMMGQKTDLILPSVNLIGAHPQLSFDVAYAQAYFPKITLNDSLRIKVSSDCGASWDTIYYKGGASLATASRFNTDTTHGLMGCFSPTASQWRHETIDLSKYNNQSMLLMAFENISGWGNWIYLDNVNILASPSGIGAEPNIAGNIKVFPNPFSDQLTINAAEEIKSMRWVDLLGKQIRVINGNGTPQIICNTDDLPQGIYVVEVTGINSQQKIKVVK